MKTIFNYSIIFLLTLVVFGCGELTIEKDSDESIDIDLNLNGITTYKGEPFSGNLTETHDNGQLEEKRTFKDGRLDGVCEKYHKNGQLKRKKPTKTEKKLVWNTMMKTVM